MMLRHVLLLVQSAAGAVVALGAFVFAAATHSPQMGFLFLAAGAFALVPLLIAAGLAAGWRWARGVGVVYELLLLLSGATDFFVLRNGDLVSIAVNTALPATLLWLLLRRVRTMEPWSSAASPGGSTRS